MTDKKKNIEKEVTGKGYEGQEEIKKLMDETMKKLSSIAGDIEKCPRKKYCGWKLGSRLLVTVGPRNLSFMLWVYQYSQKSGARLSIEPFEIKTTGKASEDVIAGLIKKVKANYDILIAVRTKREKPEPKKETFAEATIVEEVPIIKTNKKGTVSA